MSSLYADPIAPDMLGMLARHTDRDDIVDDFAIARELAEDRMKGRSFRGSPGLTADERAWAARADSELFFLGSDAPAEALAFLREHAAGWEAEPSAADIARGVIPYPTRYLAAVTPKLLVNAEHRAARLERRPVAGWALRDHNDRNSL
jgi:hypothetical protein